mmetsp:Transcript_4709/g.6691  ORF Transcript_4709/g.6691 Transcript_4709/m.6691 type:complete len:108 (+) Transcript_4709:233-556(+)
MNQFIQRIANYIANEVIVKGLAESKTFQRFALRTHTTVQDLKAKGTEQMNGTLDDFAKMANEQVTKQNAASSTTTANAAGPPKPPLQGVPGFFSAFGKEIRQDIMGK